MPARVGGVGVQSSLIFGSLPKPLECCSSLTAAVQTPDPQSGDVPYRCTRDQ